MDVIARKTGAPPPPPRDEAELASLFSNAPGQAAPAPFGPPPAEEAEVEQGDDQPAVNQAGVGEPIVAEPINVVHSVDQQILGQENVVAEETVKPATMPSSSSAEAKPDGQSGFVGGLKNLFGFNKSSAAEPKSNAVDPASQSTAEEEKPQAASGLLSGISTFIFKKKTEVDEKPKVVAPVKEEPQGIWGWAMGNIDNFMKNSPTKQPVVTEAESDDDDWDDDDVAPSPVKKTEAEIQAELRVEEEARAASNAKALKALEEKRAQKAEEERIEAQRNKKPDVVAEPVIEAFNWDDEDEAAEVGAPPPPPPPPPPPGTGAAVSAVETANQAVVDEEAKEGTKAKTPELKKKEDAAKSDNKENAAEDIKNELAAKMRLIRGAVHRDDDPGYDSDDD